MKKLISGLALSALALASHAYELRFVGRVTYTDGSLIGVTNGALVQGTLVADRPSNGLSLANMASYSFASGQVLAFVNGHTIAARAPSIQISDNLGGNVEDAFTMTGGSPLVVDSTVYQSGVLGFTLSSKPGSTGVIQGLGLPAQIDVSTFDADASLSYGFVQRNSGPNGTIFGFDVMSVTVAAAVPEPSSAWFVAVSLVGMAASLRRRSTPIS